MIFEEEGAKLVRSHQNFNLHLQNVSCFSCVTAGPEHMVSLFGNTWSDFDLNSAAQHAATNCKKVSLEHSAG
jgi:hypothetical protein